MRLREPLAPSWIDVLRRARPRRELASYEVVLYENHYGSLWLSIRRGLTCSGGLVQGENCGSRFIASVLASARAGSRFIRFGSRFVSRGQLQVSPSKARTALVLGSKRPGFEPGRGRRARRARLRCSDLKLALRNAAAAFRVNPTCGSRNAAAAFRVNPTGSGSRNAAAADNRARRQPAEPSHRRHPRPAPAPPPRPARPGRPGLPPEVAARTVRTGALG